MFSGDFMLPLFLLLTLTDVRVLACDNSMCSDKPVFSPSTLVAKYGDSTSAKCVVCQDACLGFKFNLEVPFGTKNFNGTTLTWMVSRVTQWDLSALCFYNTISHIQCCTTLRVTVYQPPERVSISIVNHTGPMFEDEEYTLQCTIHNVAPIEKLTVTFYRGQRSLGVFMSEKKAFTPETETFSVKTKPGKDDNGDKLWCQAELELGPEGPQPPVIKTSAEEVDAAVYYGPYLEFPANQSDIIITEGEVLHLNCSAEGNPPPLYAWTLPSDSSIVYNFSVFTVLSVGFEHKGQYICKVTNLRNTVVMNFIVDVRVNYIPYIIIGVVLPVIAGLVAMVYYFKQRHTGHYNLRGTFCFRNRHVAVPRQA